MTMKVELADLAKRVDEYGFAYLVTVGVRDLWRSRRHDERRGRRVLRRTLKTIAAVLATVYVAYPIIEAYAFSNVASRTAPTSELGVAHEDVSFRSTDGHLLKGWYVPSKNGAAVIVVPGRGANQEHARMLIAQGYGVLLFDERGVGESQGEHNAWGWGTENEVNGAIAFLQDRPDVDPSRIGGLGLSVGGEVLLHTASQNSGLRAVVSEGAGARSWNEYRKIDGAASWLWGPLAINRMIATSIFTNSMPPTGLHDLVPRIEVPVLFIYASRGVGGESLTEDYYDLANEPKELWKTDSGHIGGIDADPELYEQRVVGFLDEALLG
jgi:dienelactone hydrolase